jgi:hypothetical protein
VRVLLSGEKSVEKEKWKKRNFDPLILPEGGVRGQPCISNLRREQIR